MKREHIICFIVLWSLCVQRCNASVIINVSDGTDNGEQQSVKDTYVTTTIVGINGKADDKVEKAENDLNASVFGETGDNVIIRIEMHGNGDVDTGDTDEENISIPDDNKFENATIPPLICWEMTCPDCTQLESDMHCFIRSLLTVIVRSALFILVLLLLMACLYTVNHKQKKVDSSGKCAISCHEGDKAKLIEQC